MSKDSPSQELTERRIRRQETPHTSSTFCSGLILLTREQPSVTAPAPASPGAPRNPTLSLHWHFQVWCPHQSAAPRASLSMSVLFQCCVSAVLSLQLILLRGTCAGSCPCSKSARACSIFQPNIADTAYTASDPKRSHLHGEGASELVL